MERTLALGGVRYDEDPFLAYNSLKQPLSEKRLLTKSQIDVLSSLKPDSGSALRITRDTFAISSYGGGSRF